MVKQKQRVRAVNRTLKSSFSSISSTSSPEPEKRDTTRAAAIKTPTRTGIRNIDISKDEELIKLQSRIEELQSAMVSLKHERDTLLSVHTNSAHASDEIMGEGSEGSMESWDSEATDGRDAKYDELLFKHMTVLSSLKEKIGLFKSALFDAKSGMPLLTSTFVLMSKPSQPTQLQSTNAPLLVT